MKINGLFGKKAAIFTTGLCAPLLLASSAFTPAFADEGGSGPQIHEEHHSLEGLPIVLVICALIVAVGLAYGIGRRSRK